MEYIYPALFSQNDDGTYTITFPDLPGCISEGKNLENALRMAHLALTQWVDYLNDLNEELPGASSIMGLTAESNQFLSLVTADYRDTRAVKRTVSLPYWMDEKAGSAGLSLSKVLQDALLQKF